jgi:hypothetical protein
LVHELARRELQLAGLQGTAAALGGEGGSDSGAAVSSAADWVGDGSGV